MIQNYKTLKFAIETYNNKVSAYGQVQKIYSTRTTLCISLRYPGLTRYLYLGRGGGVEGVWEGSHQPVSKLRCRDKVLEYFRRHLTSGLVSALELDTKDRILLIPYTKMGRKCYFAYFWSGRKSYLCHAFYPDLEKPLKVFTSWRGEVPFLIGADLKQELLSLFDEVGRIEVGKEMSEVKLGALDDVLKKEELSSGLEKVITKKTKSLKKKAGFIQDDLKRVREYVELKRFTKNESVSLENTEEITLGTHHFKMRNVSGHHQKMNLIYEKIKKLQKAEKILEERLSSTEEALSKVHAMAPDELEVKDLPGPKFVVKKEKIELKNTKDWWEFRLRDKAFAIGRSARGNDELRSSFASKDDWWLHLDGKESAHLIIKADWHSLSPLDLSVLASALGEYSGLDIKSIGLIPIIYTQVKYLKGSKGQAGTVLYKKEKKIAINSEPEWRNLVKSLFTL